MDPSADTQEVEAGIAAHVEAKGDSRLTVFAAVTGNVELLKGCCRSAATGDLTEACLLAAVNGQLSALQALEIEGCDVRRIVARALLPAAAAGRLEIVEHLLAAVNGQLPALQALEIEGCDVRGIASKDLPPAPPAAHRLEIVERLCRLGCDIAREGAAAIRAAAAKNQIEVVEFLHRMGADISACSPAIEALVLNEAEALLSYLHAWNGLFPDGPRLLSLIRAIRGRRYAAIAANDWNLDFRSHSRILVLAASGKDDSRLMARLHEQGCDLRIDEDLALRLAAERGHMQALFHLHRTGSLLQSVDSEGFRSAAEAGRLEAVVYLAQNGANISAIDAATLRLVQLNGHQRVFNFLTGIGVDAIAPFRPALAAMREELERAAPIYRPSKLWEFFNDVNMQQLRRDGIESFKRSVNQNYFNFIPRTPFDPQLRRLLAWWLLRPTLTPFTTTCIDPDVLPRPDPVAPPRERLLRLLRRLTRRKNAATYDDITQSRLLPVHMRIFRVSALVTRVLGLDIGRSAQLALYRWLVALLWDFVVAHDKLGLARVLAEPRLGSPVEIYYRGRLISQDLAHSILECNSILEHASILGNTADQRRPLRIAEIGAGYGRLGYALLHATPCKYTVFDIPPSLQVSQWYLAELFPRLRIFRFRHFERYEDIAEELAQADLAFFTPNQIELIPDGHFDICINISSLHELRRDQIDNMLHQTYRVTRRFVYLKQYRNYVNPYDNLQIVAEDYKIAHGWRRRYLRNDAVDARFFETLIEKVAPAEHPACAAGPAPQPKAGAVPVHGRRRATVSVLLANYNHAQYLDTALAGICGQTLPASEVVVVDDGSTDDSVSVIERWSNRLPNLTLLKNGRNRGQHYSIQRALLAARGEYVLWASSDDLLLPQFLERSMELLEQYPEAGLCFSQLGVFVDGSTEVRHYTGETQGVAFDYAAYPSYLPPEMLARILRKHYVWMSGNTVVARRAALLEAGGFERSLRWHSDWFGYYVVALRYGACVIPETLAFMRERRETYSQGGISDPVQQGRVLEAILDAIKAPKYRDLLPVFRACPSLVSPFGRKTFYAALRNPRHWDMAWPIGYWHAKRRLRVLRDRLYARYPGLRKRLLG